MDGDVDPSQTMLSSGVRAAMAAPIQIGEELHALLYVDRLRGRDLYKRQDLEFLDAVANQLAVRLHGVQQVAHLCRGRSSQCPPPGCDTGPDWS